MSVLYIEPFSGLSGDMLLGALCGLADGYEDIIDLPKRLNLLDGRIEIREVNKNGIVCKHVNIIDVQQPRPQRKSHNILRKIGGILFHSHDHSHSHMHGQFHSHDHDPDLVHRGLVEIQEIIEKGNIPNSAKSIAQEIFRLIGHSESRIHNIPLSEIHFHEVSGVDSILDIVGCAVMIDRLGISKTYSDPICVGFGMVKTQHGILPVPAPATADLLTGMPHYKGDEVGEKVTPTGAAVLKWLQPEFANPGLPVQKIAYGPGRKDFINPNVVRLSLLMEVEKIEEVKNPSSSPSAPKEGLYVLEMHMDDMNVEQLGKDFQEELLALGAKDFFYEPVHMKKGRLGINLRIIIDGIKLNTVSDFLLEHTSSIGLRYYPISRIELERAIFEVDTPYGKVKVKEVTRPSGRKSRKVEHESLKLLSKKHNCSIPELEALLFAHVHGSS